MKLPNNRPTPAQIKANLRQFTGSEEFYRHGLFRSFIYTEGMNYVAETCGAYWLLDAILSWQNERQIRQDCRLAHFQFWRLRVNHNDNTAVLSCEDGNGKIVLTQDIDHTDFPLTEFTCYLINRTLLLPYEY